MATDQLIRKIHCKQKFERNNRCKRKHTLSCGIPRDPIPLTPLVVDISEKKVQETKIYIKFDYPVPSSSLPFVLVVK